MSEPRSGLARRDLLVGGLLAGGAAAIPLLRPRPAHAAPWGTLDGLVPEQLGAYRQRKGARLTLPVADPLIERTYTDLLQRLYEAPGRPQIMLLIALGDGGASGLAVHRPDECYPALGFSLSDAQAAPIGGLPRAGPAAQVVTARRGEWVEQVYFWVRIGSAFPATAWGQRLATMRGDLSGQRADGALVRLSVVEADRGRALAQLEGFNADLLGALPPAGQRLLAGQA